MWKRGQFEPNPLHPDGRGVQAANLIEHHSSHSYCLFLWAKKERLNRANTHEGGMDAPCRHHSVFHVLLQCVQGRTGVKEEPR